MKRWFACTAAVLLAAGAAQAEPWKKSVDLNLTLTQGAYSDNWAGGEVASLTWLFKSKSLFEKQLNSRLNSKNTLILSFGQTHNKDQDTHAWNDPLTVDDLIDFETVWRLTYGWPVDPYVSGRIESRFLDERDVENTRYVNPLRLTESAGIAKVFLKAEKRELNVRFGGALRQLGDRDARDPATDAVETRWLEDGGIQLAADFMTPLGDTTRIFSSRLYVYEAFFNSESDKLAGLPNEDYWRAPDVNWEVTLSAGVTKHLVFILYGQLLYDKEVALGGRVKETLGLGFTYKMF